MLGYKGLTFFLKKVLDKHASQKQKYTKVNNSNYITKALRKEIMHISTKFEKERGK